MLKFIRKNILVLFFLFFASCGKNIGKNIIFYKDGEKEIEFKNKDWGFLNEVSLVYIFSDIFNITDNSSNSISFKKIDDKWEVFCSEKDRSDLSLKNITSITSLISNSTDKQQICYELDKGRVNKISLSGKNNICSWQIKDLGKYVTFGENSKFIFNGYKDEYDIFTFPDRCSEIQAFHKNKISKKWVWIGIGCILLALLSAVFGGIIIPSYMDYFALGTFAGIVGAALSFFRVVSLS